ncbi:MAG: hypothetical protein ACR2MP_15985 [Streptosporangiaceae bacterium]
MARNECRRRRRYDPAPAGVRPPLSTGEDTADFRLTLGQAELRELAWSALGGLDPGEGEIVGLSLRHEFYGADLADALGVPRNQVHALTTRARAGSRPRSARSWWPAPACDPVPCWPRSRVARTTTSARRCAVRCGST